MTEDRILSNAEWPGWLNVAYQLERGVIGSAHVNDDGMFSIFTPEGELLVSWGDWIIQGVKGELYPCKPDIFKLTYEEVPDDLS